jgi:cell division protein FtsB
MFKFPNAPSSAFQNVAMAFMVMAIVFLFFLIIVGDNGISDLQLMKNDHQAKLAEHEDLTRKNLAIFHEIERLRQDPVYIEAIARQELGLIGKNEIIINMSHLTGMSEKK